EHDGFGRTSLCASRNNLAVTNFSIFKLGLDFGSLNPLHAVSALLHYAAAAHRDVRVAHHLQAGGVEILIQQKVKPPNFIRAVVRAIPSADATVVSHVVEAFGAVRGRRNRAHHFARRVLALLARNGLEIGLRVSLAAFVVCIHAKPVHLAAPGDLLLSYDWNVVLGDTSNNASVASDA